MERYWKTSGFIWNMDFDINITAIIFVVSSGLVVPTAFIVLWTKNRLRKVT
jgi:hypothetical protein